ncbi:hypothetical protein HWV62_15126 [Athelia sp. TMB]|nr:hypothetical protein HWV62_15126 [Athelia sp. TMB]
MTPSLSTANLLPPEIWYKIASYACTDGGANGISLSSVSKFIRESTAPFKFQSIAIHNRRQAIAFHKQLFQTAPLLRHTRFLFISLFEASSAEDIKAARRSKMRGGTDHQEARQSSDACGGILEELADSIEILFLNVSVARLDLLPALSFPRLVEMTSSGLPGCEFFEFGDESYRPLCPQLRRWHLVRQPPTRLLVDMHNIAPAITHLRFSGLDQHNSLNFHFVAALGGHIPPLNDIWEHPKHGLPKSLQKLYLQPVRQLSWEIDDDPPLTVLRNLNGVDSRLVLLKAPAGDYERGARYRICTSSEWQDCVNGGSECWSLSDRVPPKSS